MSAIDDLNRATRLRLISRPGAQFAKVHIIIDISV